jgi:Ni/Co efflux regulator RcnB
MKWSSKLLLATAVLLATTGTATAGELGVEVEFSDGEISVIQAYYRDRDAAAPGGKGKAGKSGKGLPPGIAKNLQRGKPLPPGIAKQHLPSGLLAKLPPPPKGYERIEVAGKILLVEIATQVIHDVLEDVILGK